MADVGYYDGWGFKDCEDNDIDVYVPIRDTMSEAMRKRGRYGRGDFRYDAGSDSYLCPAGRQLRRRRVPCVQSGKRYIQYAGGAEDCGVLRFAQGIQPPNGLKQAKRQIESD